MFRYILAGVIALTSVVGQAKPSDKIRWNQKYANHKDYIAGTEPIPFLKDVLPFLPKKGKALDIAMGEGRNGVYLAQHGFDVLGIDISDVGLKKAEQLASQKKVKIRTKVADLEKYKLKKNAYDVIVVSYYLQRSLYRQIKDALKPGGFVVLETYHVDHKKYAPKFNKKFLLRKNEAVQAFSNLKILRYQYNDAGDKVTASLIAQKPKLPAKSS